jgi:cellulose synthase/poly-beta-1,6-N-acetylglucosamine synthase-like glycosyltransferase
VRRDLLELLGGFVEDIDIYGEDYDLCARVYEQGRTIVYIPEATISHFPRKTLFGMLRQAFGFGRSHPYLLKRHPTGGLHLDLPGKTFYVKSWFCTAWLDLASADKKVLVLAAGGWVYQPLLLLLVLYAIWLMMATRHQAVGLGVTVSGPKIIAFSLLLVGKSLAMTVGRWWGSLKYRAVCL